MKLFAEIGPFVEAIRRKCLIIHQQYPAVTLQLCTAATVMKEPSTITNHLRCITPISFEAHLRTPNINHSVTMMNEPRVDQHDELFRVAMNCGPGSIYYGRQRASCGACSALFSRLSRVASKSIYPQLLPRLKVQKTGASEPREAMFALAAKCYPRCQSSTPAIAELYSEMGRKCHSVGCTWHGLEDLATSNMHICASTWRPNPCAISTP